MIGESSINRLANFCHGSQWVEYDEDTGLVFAWNGLNTICVLNILSGYEDVFTSYPEDGRALTLGEVQKLIAEHTQEG